MSKAKTEGLILNKRQICIIQICLLFFTLLILHMTQMPVKNLGRISEKFKLPQAY